MARFFTIATDPMTADQEKAITAVVGKAIWWHWLPNFWLVKDTAEIFTAGSLRDELIAAIGKGKRYLVLQVDPVTWGAISMKNTEGRHMSDWVSENWKKS